MGIFLKLEGIESDATDQHHKGWIACESYSGGTERLMFVETGGGKQRETSSAECSEVHLRMKMHKGSPKVFMASLLGKARHAKIHITRAGDTSGTKNYLEIDLANAYVTHYSMGYVDGNASGMPMEEISLNYTKIEKKYHPDKPDGKPGTAVPVGYDVAGGKKM